MIYLSAIGFVVLIVVQVVMARYVRDLKKGNDELWDTQNAINRKLLDDKLKTSEIVRSLDTRLGGSVDYFSRGYGKGHADGVKDGMEIEKEVGYAMKERGI